MAKVWRNWYGPRCLSPAASSAGCQSRRRQLLIEIGPPSVALATGYLMAADAGGQAGVQMRPERTVEDMWEYWVGCCRVRLEDAGVPEDWAKALRSMGADLLVVDLKALKLTRFLGASKLNQLGMIYAQAGVHLRAVQADDISDDDFREGVRVRRERPERPWRFDDYVGV